MIYLNEGRYWSSSSFLTCRCITISLAASNLLLVHVKPRASPQNVLNKPVRTLRSGPFLVELVWRRSVLLGNHFDKDRKCYMETPELPQFYLEDLIRRNEYSLLAMFWTSNFLVKIFPKSGRVSAIFASSKISSEVQLHCRMNNII